jgi:hypothetical protein
MSSTPTSETTLDRRFEIPVARWALWLSAFLVFLVIMTGRVHYTEGDARYGLLASMALLEHGSLQLDPYAAELDLVKLNQGRDWMLTHTYDPDHLYYDYPIGTPIFATPFVAIGRMLGMNPIQREDDTSMQMVIAAILCASIFLLLYRLANLYLGDWASLLFSLALFFGSTLTSTLGTALWSQDFQTFFVVLVLLELAEWERGRRPQLRARWLGFLLFAAYLCRPTSAALILPVFGYLAWRNRKALPWVLGVSGGCFLLFIGWSLLETGMVVPRYYDPSKWRSVPGFWEHWLPLWFGPARGLWAFTPVLLLVFGGWALRKVRLAPLHLLCWAWLILQTILLVRSQSPWGGWSFGPRFFTELVPGLALVLLLMADALPEMRVQVRQALLGFFIVMSVAGVYIHTIQGLNNPETMAWNDNPNIDTHWKDRRWDWAHPQFLASAPQRGDLIAERSLVVQVKQALQRIPEHASLLMGEPDPLTRELFGQWNGRDRFGKDQKLYNSLHAVQAAGVHEFYFTRALLPTVRTLPRVAIDSSQAFRICLGDYLKVHADYEIVIAGKDDCSTGPALETRAYMRSIGSQLDSVRLRQSYLLHLDHGKVLTERWSDGVLDYDLPGTPRVHLQSAGLFVGNHSSIVVDGQECSLNMRGMNVVVLDSNRKIVWITNFDTHGDDNELGMVMKARW